jgi:hypothetical protein
VANTEIDLTKAPYFNRFVAADDYHHVAFKTGVSVQSREMNEVQSIFKKQIERMGDNVFSSGTIVSGCNFLFLSPYPYIKIEDQDIFGVPVSPAALSNVHVTCDATGLRAHIIDFADGYISAAPDTKTLYLSYLNTGFNANTKTFTSGDILRVYDGIRNGIESVTINQGGSGFANTARLFAVSSLAITPLTGTFANGDYLINGLGANVQIVGIDNTSLAAQSQIVLKVAPRPTDLANTLQTSAAWTIANGQSFTNLSNTATGAVAAVIGSGFQGQIVTDGLGVITQTLILNKGVGYTYSPFVTLLSSNNVSGYSGLSLTPKNYISKISVSTVPNAVGNGYAFGVNEGTVYLDGRLLRVEPQKILVSKYDTLPDNVAVGFTSTQTLVNASIDPNLNDPASGNNFNAPGADRVKITPSLFLMAALDAESNSSVTPIVEWNSGSPYIQRQQTIYNKLGDTMAEHVFDQSGNFFIDPFLVTTRTSVDTANSFDVVVDSGTAYLNGYKIETTSNYIQTIPRATASRGTIFDVSLNYGNYIQVKELGGTFQFNTGDTVNLYDAPKGFLSNTALVKSQNTAPLGNLTGTASIRSLTLAAGRPGTNTAVYNLFVFNVNMTPGKKFTDVRSIYYNGTNKGIADVITATNPTTRLQEAQVQFANASSLVFPTQYLTVKSVANTAYIYRTLDQTTLTSNAGLLTKSLTGTLNEFFPYTGTLSNAQLNDLYLISPTKDLVSSVNASGTFSVNAATANLIGTTSVALGDLTVGDYIYLNGNSSTSDLKYVTQVVNNTFITLDSAPNFTNAVATIARCYPKNVPIPAGSRTGISANVNSNGNILTVNLGFPITSANAEIVNLGVNIARVNIIPTPKNVNRHAFVKINMANTAHGINGPWCLGVPDIFRLRGVYIGNSTVSNTGVNYVQSFSVDTNQTLNYLDLSFLYLKPSISNPATTANYILAEFDYFSTTGVGYYATPSYTQTSNLAQILLTDAQPLANLTTMSSTFEVPEIFTDDGQEIDLLGAIDFRPYAANTVSPGASPAVAPVNPGEITTFTNVEKKFPLPGSLMYSIVEYFAPRIDSVSIDQTGKIKYRLGLPLFEAGSGPADISGEMKIAELFIPQYPQIPAYKSPALGEVLTTNIINTRPLTNRFAKHSIGVNAAANDKTARRFTNKDVAKIDQRLTTVENVLSLTALETSVKSLIIPSSNDTTVNRYQFGFFADDFTTDGFTDATNPSYAASKDPDTTIVPSKFAWEVSGSDDFNGALAYINEPIVTQINATTGTAGDPTSTPQCAISLANTVAYQVIYRSAYDYNNKAPVDGTIDIQTFKMADAGHIGNGVAPNSVVTLQGVDAAGNQNTGVGQVTLWFYAYDHPVKFEIVQGGIVVADSSTATALSATEITDLTSLPKNSWFNDQSSLYLKSPVIDGSGFVKYAGRITFNYSGAGDNSVSIRTTNGTGVRNWRWVLSYPINGETAGCTPPYVPPAGGGGDPGQGYGPTVVNFNGCGNHSSGFITSVLAGAPGSYGVYNGQIVTQAELADPNSSFYQQQAATLLSTGHFTYANPGSTSVYHLIDAPGGSWQYDTTTGLTTFHPGASEVSMPSAASQQYAAPGMQIDNSNAPNFDLFGYMDSVIAAYNATYGPNSA